MYFFIFARCELLNTGLRIREDFGCIILACRSPICCYDIDIFSHGCIILACRLPICWYDIDFYLQQLYEKYPHQSGKAVDSKLPSLKKKNSCDARSILVLSFPTAIVIFRPYFSNISLPYPHQTMLWGPTRRLTIWLISTLYREKGAKFNYCH